MEVDHASSYADGGCLCGAVRYRVFGKPLSSLMCHCHSCRLASGAPAVAWITFRAGDVELLQGSPATHRSSPPVVRGFCARCGTPLSYRHRDRPEQVDLTTATLDHPELFPPDREVWLEHRVGWTAVSPDRPQHPHGSADH